MSSKRTWSIAAGIAAVVAVFALLAVAHSSGIATVAEDRAVETSPIAGTPLEAALVEPSPLEAAPLVPSPVEPLEAAPASEVGGHQFGTSINELVSDDGGRPANSAGSEARAGYAEIGWSDLIPEGASGEELMDRFEDRLDATEIGSPEAVELWEEIQAAYNPEAVNDGLNGQQVRLAGFVAPLAYEDEIVTEFLLVPTFGACIHVPPPPPNQTVLVSVPVEYGLTIDESWGAVWVEGTLAIESASTDLAEVSYKLTDATSGVYNSDI